MRYMFELSGEHPELPIWEAEALLRCQTKVKLIERDSLVAILSSDAKATDFQNRISLSHFLDEHLASTNFEDLEEELGKFDFSEYESASIRVKVTESRRKEIDANALMKRLGAILAKKTKIRLDNPQLRLRVYVGSRAHIGKQIAEIDRSQYEKRKNRLLPFTSPVSIHPRIARALINLTAESSRCRILDPFCGTGTFLIEASMMGMDVFGSDLSKKMIAGSKRNLEHLKLSAKLDQRDVGDISISKENFDCIVTDPPYGRSSTTNREPISDLYSRAMKSFSGALRNGGRVGMIVPDIALLDYRDYFRLAKRASIRVHRSLVRNFVIFEKK